MEEQILELDSVEELKKLLSSVPDNVIVSVSFGEEEFDGQTECI